MAAKLYGGAYLSSFVDAALENLSKILEHDSVLNGTDSTRELLQRLEKSLFDVAPVLDDAELKQFTDKRVKRWLVDLQDALYSTDDYLNELSTKIATATPRDPGFSSYCSSLVDSYIEGSRDLEHIVRTLETAVARKAYLCLKETAKVDMSWRIPSTSLVVTSDIFGRDKDKEEIIKLLFDDTCDAESPVTVIPIWGMGGIGKTTLAQLVYSDAEVVEKFDTMAWVCVAENFDPLGLTRTMLQKINPASSVDTYDFDSLQTRLKEALMRKTFLVVLDDVWHDQKDTWEHLLKPFQYGNHASKILLTTRSEKVASVVATTKLQYQLSLLSEEDCWLVFLKQAHLSADSINPTLEKVGKDIIKKCGRLPLAVQALGGLLRGNSNVMYWNQILKSEIWEFSHDKIKVVPALRISYYYLPSCLKKCFVYCSLYPKDYELSKSELILLWMAENFLQIYTMQLRFPIWRMWSTVVKLRRQECLRNMALILWRCIGLPMKISILLIPKLKMIYKLRPHSNLKLLEIWGYRSTRFPDWLGNSSYHNITEVTLYNCRNCRTLPSLGQLPSLKHLEISGFESVETVGDEFYRTDESCWETPFPMLETLWYESMPCWKEWRCSLEFNALPRLRKLTIRECPMLRGDLPNQLPSLQSLWIQKCEQLSCCCLPPLLSVLSIRGKHQVESMVEAIKHTRLTCLTSLYISDCSSHLLLPVVNHVTICISSFDLGFDE
ncbi:hypothetical protein PIB30_073469 [Stylosanthes scabra]|uniref:Disease resistance RPP13-like protein 1 n=1 Tax=Stylosanthes scabra TaxID=79078 RepID=A0ABU6UNV2_9FABA|nr:hypothetical protein [Stylosanthes scabra]